MGGRDDGGRVERGIMLEEMEGVWIVAILAEMSSQSKAQVYE